MSDDYAPSEVAVLIEARRKASNVSVRAAAKRAHMSDGRWRQIALGYQAITKGVRAPVNAPDETLARMARAVGLTRADLLEAGADSVADAMTDEPESAAVALSDLPNDALLAELARRLHVEGRDGHDQQPASSTRAGDAGYRDPVQYPRVGPGGHRQTSGLASDTHAPHDEVEGVTDGDQVSADEGAP